MPSNLHFFQLKLNFVAHISYGKFPILIGEGKGD